MPATYAHFQFGQQMARFLPEEARTATVQFSDLYQVGFHGPDPLFYYNPFVPNAIGRLGSAFHLMTGQEFFGPICRRLHSSPNREEEAFAWGLLTHYCLDSACHPYINELDRQGVCGHSELETEFDRVLLERAGEERPHRADLGRHLKLSASGCAAAARCLGGVAPEQLRRSVGNMKLFLQVLGSRTILSRELLEGVMPMLGDLKQYLMSRHRVERLAPMILEVLALYTQAAGRFPRLAAQFSAAIREGRELGEDFAPIFG